MARFDMQNLEEKIKKASGVDRKTVQEYTERLKSILCEFSSAGFDVKEIEKNLAEPGSDRYIQEASELSAAYYFMKTYPEDFDYQVPSHISRTRSESDKRKNFDFSFSFNGFTFNVDVKNFSRRKENENSLPVKVFLNKPDQQSLYRSISEQEGLGFSPNRLPAVGRFLKKANDQLTRPESGFSVVLISCNNLDELTDVVECFVNRNCGICFKEESDSVVPAPKDLENIDAVVICNLAFEHQAIFDSSIMVDFYGRDGFFMPDGSSVWDYKRTIPVLPILIPLRKKLVDNFCFKSLQEAFFSHNAYIFTDNFDGLNQNRIFDYYNYCIAGEKKPQLD